MNYAITFMGCPQPARNQLHHQNPLFEVSYILTLLHHIHLELIPPDTHPRHTRRASHILCHIPRDSQEERIVRHTRPEFDVIRIFNVSLESRNALILNKNESRNQTQNRTTQSAQWLSSERWIGALRACWPWTAQCGDGYHPPPLMLTIINRNANNYCITLCQWLACCRSQHVEDTRVGRDINQREYHAIVDVVRKKKMVMTIVQTQQWVSSRVQWRSRPCLISSFTDILWYVLVNQKGW